MRRNVALNGLAPDTPHEAEISEPLPPKGKHHVEVRVNEGDAWCVHTSPTLSRISRLI